MKTEQEIQELTRIGRDFMRMPVEDDDYQTDQQLRRTQPPLCKPPMGGAVTELPRDFTGLALDNDFLHVIGSRKSSRVYTGEPITLTELSYLLWTTQGVKEIRGNHYATLRTVPCGGARHEFECYFTAQAVTGLVPGAYHYLPMKHAVEFIAPVDDMAQAVGESLCGQNWASKAAVTFYYSVVPYRAEWRYGIYAHRIALVDAGHITENLYLACTAAGLGTCAVGAVEPALCDRIFTLDGEEEFIFYAAPVGRTSPEDAQKELDFYAFLKETGD